MNTARDPQAHLSPAELYELEAGTMADPAAQAARVHLAQCGACRAEAALARSFATQASEAPPQDVAAAARARLRASTKGATPGAAAMSSPGASTLRFPRREPMARRWTRRRGGLTLGGWLATASMLALAGITWQAMRAARSLTPSGEVRGSHPEAAWEPRVEVLPGARWRVQWQPVPGADVYEVRVQSPDGELLWQHTAAAPPLEIARDELPAEAAPTTTWLIRVIASGPAGLHRESALRALPPLEVESPHAPR